MCEYACCENVDMTVSGINMDNLSMGELLEFLEDKYYSESGTDNDVCIKVAAEILSRAIYTGQ